MDLIHKYYLDELGLQMVKAALKRYLNIHWFYSAEELLLFKDNL
jgi:hypothetical protein